MDPDDPGDTDPREGPFGRRSQAWIRRRFLTTSAAVASLGLAGCSGLDSYSFTAAPVALDDDAVAGGYDLGSARTIELSRTFSLPVGEADVSMTNHAVSYEQSAETFLDDVGVGLLATPKATVAGRTLNPMNDRSTVDLLRSNIGWELLAEMNVQATGWARGPVSLGTSPGRLLGSSVTVETFAGVTNDEDVVLLSVTRADSEDDLVFVGDARSRGATGTPDPATTFDDGTLRDAVASFTDLLSHVVRADPKPGTGGSPAGEQTTTPAAELPPGRIPMADVPSDVRRRAARFIERHSGEDPRSWQEAALGSYAHPISRPDVDGTAYYELEVEPEGYVILATGRHDAPIPHFGTEGTSVGRYLEEKADGTFGGTVWIDRLRYVAEDPEGNAIATRGNEVPRIEGIEQLAERSVEGGHVRAGPEDEDAAPTDDDVDESYEPTMLVEEIEQPPPETFEFTEWESHEQLKRNYEDAYRPFLDDLRKRAKTAWDVLAEREGKLATLPVGATHREPLLDGETTALVGDAASHVRLTTVTREVGQDLLELTPLSDAAAGLTATLTFTDATGRTDSQAFEFVERALVPSETDATIQPAIDVDDGDGTAFLPTRSWAGGAGLQCWYGQHQYQGCPVGCGPVAWAMLFGWADRQANNGRFNSTWWRRWGLYRSGGGRGGDAVAPRQMSNGVRSVLEELNDDVDVFCIGDNGATAPWDMGGATRYLHGRTGTSIEYWWSGSGIPWGRCKREARESIKGNANNKGPTPTIVGKGWLSHYPLAYAYSDGWWDYFKINNGWFSNHPEKTEWIWAPTWFSGEIYP